MTERTARLDTELIGSLVIDSPYRWYCMVRQAFPTINCAPPYALASPR